MTNIRDYVKKKEKRQEESLGKKILRHRLTVFYRIVLTLVLVVAVAFAIVVHMKNRVFESYQIISSVEKENLSLSNCRRLGEKALIYTNDGASCIDRKGQTLWDQPFEMQSPLISICNNVVALGDYNGSIIYVMNDGQTLGEIDTKMPIRDFAVSENGVVAAVLDDASVTWIYLFDSTGNTLAYFKTTMRQSGYPIWVTISDNGQLVGVSYFYLDSGMIKSSVAFYNFGPVGQNEIDNFVSSYDYMDSVVPFVEFMNNEKAVAVADNRLVIYEGSQKPVSIADVLLEEEIETVYCGSNYVGLVYMDVTGNALYRVDIYDDKGVKMESVSVDMEFSEIIFHKNRMIIYSEQECLIHTINGVDNFKGSFEKSVLALIPTNASHEYIAVTSDSIDVIELK